MSRRKLKRLARPDFWRRVGKWGARHAGRAFLPFGFYLLMVFSLALLPGMAVQSADATPELPAPAIYSATFTPVPQPAWPSDRSDRSDRRTVLDDPLPTPTPVPCVDRAEFLADVTIPDKFEVRIGEVFRKAWRVRNIGNCAWDYYGLAFALEDRLNGPDYLDFQVSVAPGEEIVVSIVLVAPDEPGRYHGAWALITGRQEWKDALPLWVDINAVESTQNDCYDQLDLLSVQSRWAAIVAGEAISSGAEGMRLVAWTMQAQVVYWGRDPALFGPNYGWYGCRLSSIVAALPYVEEAFGQDPTSAPYKFMQTGDMCSHLGSYDDQMLWLAQGKYGAPADYVVGRGLFTLHCFFTGFRKTP